VTFEVTRRDFLQAAMVGLMGGGLVTACGTPKNTSSRTVPTERLLAGVEIAIISAYQSVINGLRSGRLGTVPPVVTELTAVAQSHHQAHIDHWNESLVNGRQSRQSGPDAQLSKRIRSALVAIKTIPDALELLALIEEISAETCARNLQTVPDSSVRTWCALIAPVESQHATVFRMLLGQEPTPAASISLSLARI
jgi:hypothetical protein